MCSAANCYTGARAPWAPVAPRTCASRNFVASAAAAGGAPSTAGGELGLQGLQALVLLPEQRQHLCPEGRLLGVPVGRRGGVGEERGLPGDRGLRAGRRRRLGLLLHPAHLELAGLPAPRRHAGAAGRPNLSRLRRVAGEGHGHGDLHGPARGLRPREPHPGAHVHQQRAFRHTLGHVLGGGPIEVHDERGVLEEHLLPRGPQAAEHRHREGLRDVAGAEEWRGHGRPRRAARVGLAVVDGHDVKMDAAGRVEAIP
mmetsp:Transcript_57265/g.158488  ORF Transcript_57265/g.158488 Transcript_57265/m.158488 type:complete len:256 (-) Transcript_57265:387-1154(-)